MPHGKNYTVEEQVTGKADHGGFQFDIFPRRTEPMDGFRYITRSPTEQRNIWRRLEAHKTPEELSTAVGGMIDIRK